MPRKYIPKGNVRYRQYNPKNIAVALNDVRSGGSVKEVAKMHKIPISTLRDKLKGAHPMSHGGQPVFTADEELTMESNLLICADYGMPLCNMDIKLFVKGYLNKLERNVNKFKNNTPGDEWVKNFLARHKNLSYRMCQNIKRVRSELKPSEIREYFSKLKETLKDVLPENIMNYDETNLADDPGMKKCVFKRGVKYPERVINYSKGNISLLFAGTASGELLPPYVVYKSTHLWDSWCKGGPPHTRYGRSVNGWMNLENFEEWFFTIVVPWARRREGKKVLIGDNLSSHLSFKVLSECLRLNISFVMLVPNSTDKCQPLDVAYFGPQKKVWRQMLDEHRTKYPSSTGLNKATFPTLLKTLINRMDLKNEKNLKAGFKACGIYPFNPEAVLKKMPAEESTCTGNVNDTTECQSPPTRFISPALLEYLQQFRYDPDRRKEGPAAKKKKISLEPGKSISAEDLLLIEKEKAAKKAAPKRRKKQTKKSLKSTPSGSGTSAAAPSTALKSTLSGSGTSAAAPSIEEHSPPPPESSTPASTAPMKETPAPSTPPENSVCDTDVGDFIIVKVPCEGKEQKHKFYVAKVVSSDADGMIDVKYLKQSGKAPNRFSFPVVIETGEIDKEDILMKLPDPNEKGPCLKTKRQAQMLSFGQYDLTYCE